MIDTNELRRLVQAATPGPWINYGRQPNAPGAPHSAVAAKTLLARVYSEAYGDVAQETANADLIAAANPAAISELLDRLEAAEQERDALRTKIAEMEQQTPVAWMLNCPTLGGDTGWILSWTKSGAGVCNRLSGEENEKKLYALPGAKGE